MVRAGVTLAGLAAVLADIHAPLPSPCPPTDRTTPPAQVAAADVATGAMIALVPTADPDPRRPLALDPDIPGAEPAEQLHVTLAYLGDGADWTPQQRAALLDRLQLFAGGAPVPAKAFGAAHWNPDTTEPSWVLNLSGDLLAIVHMLVWDLLREGVSSVDLPELPEQYVPWQPHLCLAYSPDPGLAAVVAERVGPLTFDRVRVAFAGDITDLKLDGAVNEEPADLAAQLLERFHLPGGHRQKDHGGGDGADLPSLKDLYDADDPVATANDIYGFRHGGLTATVGIAVVSPLEATVRGKITDDTGAEVGLFTRRLLVSGDGVRGPPVGSWNSRRMCRGRGSPAPTTGTWKPGIAPRG